MFRPECIFFVLFTWFDCWWASWQFIRKGVKAFWMFPVPAFICGIDIMSLKVMCMQFDMYLALEPSPPDRRLMGSDPSCQEPIIKPHEWPALKSIPSQASSFLLGRSSLISFWVLFLLFCLSPCSSLSFHQSFCCNSSFGQILPFHPPTFTFYPLILSVLFSFPFSALP